MSRPRFFGFTSSLLLSFFLLPGCGSGDDIPREAIQGKVTLDGKPLESGTIRFLPADPAAPPTAAEATIATGSYSISASQGLTPGNYLVAISSVVPGEDPTAKKRPVGRPEDNGTGAIDAPVEPPTHDQIPRKFNINSTLKADVAPGKTNTFDFPLTSK